MVRSLWLRSLHVGWSFLRILLDLDEVVSAME
jgi:hypothetical protein